MSDEPDITVVEAPGAHRFEIHVDGTLAGFVDYVHRDGRWIVPHTEIDPAFEGRGLASVLTKGLVDHVRAAGEQLVPLCPYTATWIQRHPEHDDLVDHALLEHYRSRG